MSDEGKTAPREMKERREVECEEGGGAEANVGAVGAVQKVLSSVGVGMDTAAELHCFSVGRREASCVEMGAEVRASGAACAPPYSLKPVAHLDRRDDMDTASKGTGMCMGPNCSQRHISPHLAHAHDSPQGFSLATHRR